MSSNEVIIAPSCFFAETYYQRYLHDFHQAALRNRVQMHAYVLMTNHVHLLLTPETHFGLAHTMQDTGGTFVRYTNSAYPRTGSLWQGRYKASLIDSEKRVRALLGDRGSKTSQQITQRSSILAKTVF